MVVQHFSHVGFSRNKWPAEAQKILDNLKLSYKKLSKLEYTNPPIELGEVYLGYKESTNRWKLIYILPKPIFEGDDKVWATFVRIYPPNHQEPNGAPWNETIFSHPPKRSVWGAPTRMSVTPDMWNPFDEVSTLWRKRKIEKSYPEYISLTQLKESLTPIQFMNWMWERPISPKEEPKITKEEPEEPRGVPWDEHKWDKDSWEWINK